MYQERPGRLVKHLDFMLMDLICLMLALWLACRARLGEVILLDSPTYRGLFMMTVLAHLCVVVFTLAYKDILYRGYLKEFLAVCEHILLVLAVVLIGLFFMKLTDRLSRIVMLYQLLLSLVFLWTERVLWKRLVRRFLKSNPRLLLLVTDREGAERVLDHFKGQLLDFKILGIVLIGEEPQPLERIGRVPVVAEMKDMVEFLRTHPTDEVLFSIPQGKRVPDQLVRACRLMGLTVHMEIPLSDSMLGAQYAGNIYGLPVMTSCIKAITPTQAMLKRLMDICGAIVGLLLTGLLFLFVAPAIYIADPGPVLFAQDRVGKNGRIFKMYKFRSMYQDAEARKAELMARNEMQGQMFKLTDDPRIIGSGPDGTRHGLGWFIRSTSIDEFPQFWNVLKGDLSLCGFRPALKSECDEYHLHHYARMSVKPGITGMWQVSGRSEITDFEEVVKLDLEYIQNWSLSLDVKLLFKTVLVVLKREGSK